MMLRQLLPILLLMSAGVPLRAQPAAPRPTPRDSAATTIPRFELGVSPLEIR